MIPNRLPAVSVSPGLLFTPLRRIATPKGEVRHGLRASDAGFAGFGEVYFTEVLPGAVKGWKRHRLMTLNLVVVCGTVRFIVHDGAQPARRIASYVISAEGAAPYGRLTVPPGLWMGFQGLGQGRNLLMNLASHEHDPTEAESCELEVFADAIPISAQIAPATSQVAPATAQDAPSTAQVTPATAQVTPATAQGAPAAVRATPAAVQPASLAAQPARSTAQATQATVQAAPAAAKPAHA